jgi:predicted enzyme related to lactoylglutathione lyase
MATAWLIFKIPPAQTFRLATKAVPQATRLNEVGALCWTELYTRDPEKVSNSTPHFSVGVRNHGKRGQCRTQCLTLPMRINGWWHAGDAQRNAGLTALASYFQVEDADASAEHAEQLGGQMQPADGHPKYRAINARGPAGSSVAIIKLTQ